MNKTEVFDKKDMVKYLPEFIDLYEKRVIKDNNGGMKSSHLFPVWYIIKTTKPKYIIESGVWKGLGTWFFESASPESKIISIDPDESFRVYTSPNVTYRTTDFTQQKWDDVEPENTLVFFDDHQNSMQRIRHCKKLGFKKIIFEDNYPYLQGDCYSPKKVLSQKSYVIDSMGQKNWFEPNKDDYDYFITNVSVYQEMPPLFKRETTRWNDKWDDTNYETVEPILCDADIENNKLFYEEANSYTWLCYLELN